MRFARILLAAFNRDLEEFKKFTYMKQHYYTFTEQAFHLLAGRTGLKVSKFNYMQVWGLDNQLSWLRHKRPRDFSVLPVFFPSKLFGHTTRI